jgi:uncharacterized protein YjaZ
LGSEKSARVCYRKEGTCSIEPTTFISSPLYVGLDGRHLTPPVFIGKIAIMSLVKLYVGCPEGTYSSVSEAAEAMSEYIPDDENTGYAGYLEREQLVQYLEQKFSKIDKHQIFLRSLDKAEQKRIQNLIEENINACSRVLESTAVVSVYIFPWIGGSYDADFEGVTGYTPYTDTIHLYINLDRYSDKSLVETLSHEFHHAVFMRSHEYSSKLIESMVFEGLADNFRESVIGGEPSPWSIALSEEEARQELRKLGPLLEDESFDLYEKVFFGSDEYVRWTGYSIGYRIVEAYLQKHPQYSWKALTEIPLSQIVKEFAV